MKEQAAALHKVEDEFQADLRALGAKYIGKDGTLHEVLKQLGDLPAPERSVMGERINRFVDRVKAVLDGYK